MKLSNSANVTKHLMIFIQLDHYIPTTNKYKEMTVLRILFLTTAHNSLSQRAYIELTDRGHEVSIELALTDDVMIEAVDMFRPDLIIGPMLKKFIPEAIWKRYTCLIVHPGIPGDTGPLRWIGRFCKGRANGASQYLRQMESMMLATSGRPLRFPCAPRAKAVCIGKKSQKRLSLFAAGCRAFYKEEFCAGEVGL